MIAVFAGRWVACLRLRVVGGRVVVGKLVIGRVVVVVVVVAVLAVVAGVVFFLVVVVVVVVAVKIHAHFPHVCGTYFTIDTSYLLWLKGKRVHQGRE